MRHYDLVVVGASFAGLACARIAAQRGLQTCVLEKRSQPGQIIHTTGLLVQEAATLLDAPAALTRRIEGVRLYSPSLRYMDLDAPGYAFYATDTAALLQWMARQAVSAGAELRCGEGFRDARRRQGRIIVNDRACSTHWLVGADGARSQVAARFGLGRNCEYLLGIEAEFEGLNLGADRLHCFVDSELAPGYIGWAFTGVGGTVQMGLACRRPHKPDLDAFLARLGRIFDFSKATMLSKRGGLIPVGGIVRAWHSGRVLLIGDAAGIVSPLTAGGIHTGLQAGIDAAETIAALRHDEGPAVHRQLAALHPGFFWKRQLRWLFDLRPPNALIERLMFNAPMRWLARWIYFHRKRLPGPG